MPHGGHVFGQIKYFLAIFVHDHLYCESVTILPNHFNSKEEDVLSFLYRPPDIVCIGKQFFFSNPKHMLWVL